MVVLEPLTEDATPFETALRGELLKAMKLFPTAKESEVNKMLNASREVVHKFCTMFSTTLEVRALLLYECVFFYTSRNFSFVFENVCITKMLLLTSDFLTFLPFFFPSLRCCSG